MKSLMACFILCALTVAARDPSNVKATAASQGTTRPHSMLAPPRVSPAGAAASPVSKPDLASAPASVRRFESWLKKFQASTSAMAATMAAEGEFLAKNRREAIRDLIQMQFLIKRRSNRSIALHVITTLPRNICFIHR